MAWWNAIGGILQGGKALSRVFKADATKAIEYEHKETLADTDRDKATLSQYAAEYVKRENRTWWDSLMDGANRSVRPILAFGVLFFFVLAPINPEQFVVVAEAYSLMPAGFWALLSVIVGFYFGGRMQIKSQDMRLKRDAVAVAKRLTTVEEEFKATSQDRQETAYRESVKKRGKPTNQEIIDWLTMKASREENEQRQP